MEDTRGGRRPESVKLSEKVVQNIVSMIHEKPDITLKKMKQKWFARQPSVDLSTTSIARALDGQLVTMKKLQDCPAQRNSLRVKRDRVHYAEWYLQQAVLPVTTLIYVDETCFNLFTERSLG